MDDKETLYDYLRIRRADLLAKLDGLSEYDARRPMTPTGTNLAGLVKHVASVQLGYLGEVFGRPAERRVAWELPDGAEDDDMWVTPGETVADVVEFHHYSAAHADATVEALASDAAGVVGWWPEERRHVTLQRILVHLLSETARHAGHADILRETIDGSIGNGASDPNLPGRSPDEWEAFRAKIESAAHAAASTE
ncbi:hypothetical protein GCM10025867_34800 [Frondihabitans sucicola]|uniref:DinB family protein n=1 Tax=Frondihabitans sucicola TaxID=1268041 RepID=A0ABM8GS02_9MICO|nr:DinB family protein [Frondihabitans sucicola]BDZ51239.1 hypothetical protein GCM10025867_34800 [Frondihabitans sucicola]